MRQGAPLGPLDVFGEINRQFDTAIIVTDVGQHQMLTSQYVEITEKKQLIMSGGLGTMGYGFPGGIGAQIGNPDKPVIVISGDGGMQMNIQEFATAVLEELPVIICVFNNEYLGMVRQWQKLFYGKRDVYKRQHRGYEESPFPGQRPSGIAKYSIHMVSCHKE